MILMSSLIGMQVQVKSFFICFYVHFVCMVNTPFCEIRHCVKPEAIHTSHNAGFGFQIATCSLKFHSKFENYTLN